MCSRCPTWRALTPMIATLEGDKHLPASLAGNNRLFMTSRIANPLVHSPQNLLQTLLNVLFSFCLELDYPQHRRLPPPCCSN